MDGDPQDPDLYGLNHALQWDVPSLEQRSDLQASQVRADVEPGLGFLVNPRRTNVAISRAKFGLAIVCDPRAVINDPHWAACVAYAACLGGMVVPSEMAVPLPGSNP